MASFNRSDDLAATVRPRSNKKDLVEVGHSAAKRPSDTAATAVTLPH
jgi:hypothetical protein